MYCAYSAMDESEYSSMGNIRITIRAGSKSEHSA